MVETIAGVLEASIIDENQTIILEKFRQRSFPMSVYHRMEAIPNGTRIYTNLTVGDDTPFLGRIHNALLRKKMRISTEEAYNVWFVHVKEEGQNLEKFLPKLFAECADSKWK